MAKHRKSPEDVEREERQALRARKIQEAADARRDDRAKRQTETAADQRDRLAQERAERERAKQERASRARSEKARMLEQRDARRTEQTSRQAQERERARLERQAEADRRKADSDLNKKRNRLVMDGWSPKLIMALESKGSFQAVLRGGTTPIDFVRAKQVMSSQWVALFSNEDEYQEVRLADILSVSGNRSQEGIIEDDDAAGEPRSGPTLVTPLA